MQADNIRLTEAGFFVNKSDAFHPVSFGMLVRSDYFHSKCDGYFSNCFSYLPKTNNTKRFILQFHYGLKMVTKIFAFDPIAFAYAFRIQRCVIGQFKDKCEGKLRY